MNDHLHQQPTSRNLEKKAKTSSAWDASTASKQCQCCSFLPVMLWSSWWVVQFKTQNFMRVKAQKSKMASCKTLHCLLTRFCCCLDFYSLVSSWSSLTNDEEKSTSAFSTFSDTSGESILMLVITLRRKLVSHLLLTTKFFFSGFNSNLKTLQFVVAFWKHQVKRAH